MSIFENMVRLEDAAEFTWEIGEFIALELAKGGNLKALHEAFPEEIPNPIVINRWRKRIPAFDLLMLEAEEAKAEWMVDEIMEIADDQDRQSAHVRNAVDARKWLAEKLNRGRFGSVKEGGQGGVGNLNVILTDEQLMAIAAGALPDPSVVEGASERKDVDES